ncbi:GyrI-like domain-containing protein [Paenibacillus algicola]|uniref:GyrI-like domain-containing protein n=1 Tax=Paenibacillus algicola TaxID=2565926 RepID=UPI001E49E6DD|nr:GyrI-like domain-containing protein [Paenibacillus algicola]
MLLCSFRHRSNQGCYEHPSTVLLHHLQHVLLNSEYDADDRPCLEFCINDPAKDKEGKCKVDLYIPIKKRI